MVRDPDEERIRRKAHELWEADGRRHGLDQDHWIQAREIIAIEDSQADALLPRDSGAEEPIEDADEALRNLADFPNLTDQGENLLTSTDREPALTGAGTDMPAVEVPTSDQPGVPQNPPRAPTKPEPDMQASSKCKAAPIKAASNRTSPAAPSPAKPAPGAKQTPAKTSAPKKS